MSGTRGALQGIGGRLVICTGLHPVHPRHRPVLPMRCSDFRPQHLAWLAGELPGSEAMAMRVHTDRCARCRRYDRLLRIGLLQARNATPLQVSSDFATRLHARLHAESASAPRGETPLGGIAETAILPAYGRHQLQVASDGPRDRGLRPGVRLPRCG
ncbi:anti-sigma factor family protein [Pseudogemmatithrix spongiicola]|uniref:anti-sigma factor family protein n=1 Tax=Pseudogemmatithrix spongiicola TaxID=3062599 RepID=UPI003466A0CB